ncbi:diaminopimelate decarboxylase [Parasaccharibacter sp. TMW2.1882]|uniref:diaminopimelate decarboxylase n=1 Tax=unclassified Parasaccharibacter TaxID=2626400 RepID=UPI00200A8AD1|nr:MULTISPECIES: diaminopimelate decarboxylase [unclassified Parasaccharibacter]MCK8636571.1 diaminopimelate decarboxylase [Parasaccharibacter sp. TMW2.1885]MCL1496390.1 diaminopimelate decarboxylase [Parasaccharibacter sp. TMW2.1882]
MTSTHPDPTFQTLLNNHPNLSYEGRQGLVMDGTSLTDIAREHGTPCWVISADTLRQRAHALQDAFRARNLPIHCHFAVKAQDHQACLTVLAHCGFGADVVSGGELRRALAAGIRARDIVFSGIGKTDDELELAIHHQIGQINVESVEELHRINALTQNMQQRARIAFRVNPDIDAQTHSKITTGRAEDKFGIDHDAIPALYRKAQTDMHGVELVGLAVHLGSQMVTAAPFRKGYERIAALVRTLREDGLHVSDIDCGGGLGIAYRNEQAPPPAMLADVIAETLGDLDVQLHVEPGRWLAAPAGVLLARVIDVKDAARRFVIIDAGMNDLVRPAMYDSWHGILPLSEPDTTTEECVDVVGPICESSDIFARQRSLPPLKKGDLVALLDAGAYGTVMSSTYNSRPLAAQVMIEGGRKAIIRRRQTLEELLAQEAVPDWLARP